MNGIISKTIHITILAIHPVSGLTEIASSLLCSRTAFIGHDRGTGCATERREKTGVQQYWAEI
jgi:hypothetical protein